MNGGPLRCIGLLALSTLYALTTSSRADAGEPQGPPRERAPIPVAWPDQREGATASTPADDGDRSPAADYLVPDVPSGALVYNGDRLSLRPIFALVADYTFFEQDEPSLVQVGEQEDAPDLRAARLGVILRTPSERPWEAAFIADYQERRRREDQVFQIYDLRLRIPVGPVRVDIGKQKQPFVYELVGLSITNPQQERILSPFFVTRSIGVLASGQLAGDRMTWAAGWFNDWLESNATFEDNASDYVARVTGLVSASPDNRDYLHLGLGLRRVGPDAGIVRLSGRPESNIADKYVDTGEFEAEYVGQVSFELAWDRGPFLLVAEQVAAWARAPESGDPRFSGGYLTLAWVVTGESRPYNRSAGSAGPITPSSRYGALELVTRYSYLDLADAAIDGGKLRKWHVGANWWVSPQWKAGVSYGDADLRRDGTTGNTRLLLTRVQWLY